MAPCGYQISTARDGRLSISLFDGLIDISGYNFQPENFHTGLWKLQASLSQMEHGARRTSRLSVLLHQVAL